MAWLVVKAHQLVRTKCERSVCLTGVIAELNFVHAGRKTLDDGADLAPQKPLLGDILEQGNHSKHLDFSHRKLHFNSTKQLVSCGTDSLGRMIQVQWLADRLA